MSSLCFSWGKKHLEAWLRPSAAAAKCRCGQVPLRSAKFFLAPLENFRPPLGEAKGAGLGPSLNEKACSGLPTGCV